MDSFTKYLVALKASYIEKYRKELDIGVKKLYIREIDDLHNIINRLS